MVCGTGERLSKSTLHATLANLSLQRLAGQPGYKSRFQYSDADYFNLSEKDVRVATATREKRVPTMEAGKTRHCPNAIQYRNRTALLGRWSLSRF